MLMNIDGLIDQSIAALASDPQGSSSGSMIDVLRRSKN